MAKHAEYIIKGVDDFELGIKRQNPLKYFLTLPDSEKIEGLVFLIPGFGEDSNAEYITKFRTFVADDYSLACVSVSYHAINARRNKNANIVFEFDDIERLNELLRHYGCPLNYKSIDEAISVLDQAIERQGAVYPYPFLYLTALLNFGDEQTEYQNFGVMQALDHVYVLYDLQKRIRLHWGKIIAIGSSHGGYIANLLSKFAPNTLTAVFDNSSYADPPLNYVMGRECKPAIFHPCEMVTKNIGIYYTLKSGWTTNSLSSNYYSEDARKIRRFLYEGDIKKMALMGNNKTQYRFFHSKYDFKISNVHEKMTMVDFLKKYNFDSEIYLMDHCDVDGRFVKTLDHGMNLSLKKMFAKLYPDVKRKDECSDITLKSLIIYEGIKGDYVFQYESDKVMPQFIKH
jgi:hypothetical protein